MVSLDLASVPPNSGAMLPELIIATFMVMVTVTIHAAGLFALNRLLRIETREEARHNLPTLSPRGLAVTLTLVIGLFILHGLEIWTYGFLYLFIGAIDTLREAVYFSTITYATIGYDDGGFPHEWRLIAAIEGINGIILLGWSTAFFVTVLPRLGRK